MNEQHCKSSAACILYEDCQHTLGVYPNNLQNWRALPYLGFLEAGHLVYQNYPQHASMAHARKHSDINEPQSLLRTHDVSIACKYA